jgi:hypothetical protein
MVFQQNNGSHEIVFHQNNRNQEMVIPPKKIETKSWYSTSTMKTGDGIPPE